MRGTFANIRLRNELAPGKEGWWTATAPGAEPVAVYDAAMKYKAEGIPTDAELAFGEPAKEIIRWVQEKHCDLLAMSTHGHRLIGDIVFGVTASRVQHEVKVPVLLLRAE